MRRDPHMIVKCPMLTEKSTQAMENGTYTFKVATDANRIEIKQAIEFIFDVKVKKVNTLNRSGKRKRVGKSVGRTSGFKKALVTLNPVTRLSCSPKRTV